MSNFSGLTLSSGQMNFVPRDEEAALLKQTKKHKGHMEDLSYTQKEHGGH